MNKLLALIAAVGIVPLAGCGQSGQQSTGTTGTQPSAEHTTPVTASSIQPVAAGVVSSAQLSGEPCSLDSVDGSYAARVPLSKSKPAIFRGWLESHQRHPAGSFSLVLIGKQAYGIPAKTGVDRPDVASGRNDPGLEAAGFNFSAILDVLPAGDYSVRFLMSEGGKAYWCDTKKTVILR